MPSSSGGPQCFSHFPKMRCRTMTAIASNSAPEKCMEAFHLQRTRFELTVERKVRRRHLTNDGNVEINGRDLRERVPMLGQHDLVDAA